MQISSDSSSILARFQLTLLVALVLMTPWSAAWGARPIPAEGTVSRVTVEGTRRIDEAAVLAAIGLRQGERLSPEKVRRDLNAVYDTGFFKNVFIGFVEW